MTESELVDEVADILQRARHDMIKYLQLKDAARKLISLVRSQVAEEAVVVVEKKKAETPDIYLANHDMRSGFDSSIKAIRGAGVSELDQLKERINDSRSEGIEIAFIRNDYDPIGDLMIKKLVDSEEFVIRRVGAFDDSKWKIFKVGLEPYF